MSPCLLRIISGYIISSTKFCQIQEIRNGKKRNFLVWFTKFFILQQFFFAQICQEIRENFFVVSIRIGSLLRMNIFAVPNSWQSFRRVLNRDFSRNVWNWRCFMMKVKWWLKLIQLCFVSSFLITFIYFRVTIFAALTEFCFLQRDELFKFSITVRSNPSESHIFLFFNSNTYLFNFYLLNLSISGRKMIFTLTKKMTLIFFVAQE